MQVHQRYGKPVFPKRLGGDHGTGSGILQHSVFETRGVLIPVLDLPMEKSVHPPPPTPQPHQQQREFLDYRKRKAFEEDDLRSGTAHKKTRLYSDPQHLLNNEGSNSTYSQKHRSCRTSRSPPPGYDHSNTHKTPHSNSAPSRVNWRLACFMAREYLSRGTLLGKSWPPNDSKRRPPGKAVEQPMKNFAGDEGGSEGETFYSSFTTNFLSSDDIQIPGIVNPSQMAAWLGLI